MRDITDDGSGSIKACLCQTDYCNDDQTADSSKFEIENEIFTENSLDNLVTQSDSHEDIDDLISSTKFLKPTSTPKVQKAPDRSRR